MKRFSISILLCALLASLPMYGQPEGEDTLLSLATRLKRFGERIPQEKVFVHMDNTCYFLGDTIWFAVYSRQTNTDTPSKISRVLYAELWNNDGYLVERKMVEMIDGKGHGFFGLTDSLMYGGFYELRAYTRWQLNWGEYQHQHKRVSNRLFFNDAMAREYFRDYEKLYSRVFPVYDRPTQPGYYFRDMTQRPLEYQLGSNYKSKNILSVTLYPEGGHFIGGVPNRFAFEAAMTDGEYVDGVIEILDNDGNLVTQEHTQNRGRGIFTINATDKGTYTAIFKADKLGNENDVRSCKTKLPKIEKDGVAIKVEKNNENWQISLSAKGLLMDRHLGMTVISEGRQVVFNELSMTSGVVHQFVPDSLLQAGVNQVTIFDTDGRIYADRLFFVTKAELMSPTLSISGMKEEYKPFEQVSLQVAAPVLKSPSHTGEVSRLSLSVRDAVHQDNIFDSGNILTEMLLASEIKGFVPQPEYFFEADDAEHRRALDLLMMTQGWRRFNWRDMAVSGQFELVHPAEYSPILTGSVHKYDGHLKQDPNLEVVYLNHFLMLGYGAEDAKESLNELFGLKSFGHGYHQYKGKNYNRTERMDQIKGLSKEMRSKMAHDGEKLRREVRVHAEFTTFDNKEAFVGDVETEHGRFTLKMPRFYGHCLFFLGASDTTKWGRRFLFWKRKPHHWIMADEDEYPEFYVRLSYPYPNFIKPYTYYQINTQSGDEEDWDDMGIKQTGIATMKPLVVNNRKRKRISFKYLKPIVVKDAYDAFNTVVDAGFIEGWYTGIDNLGSSFGRYLAAEMGGGIDYKTKAWIGQSKDKAYVNPNSEDTHRTRIEDQKVLGYLKYIDRVEVYCDYSPRLEGDRRFQDIPKPPMQVVCIRFPMDSVIRVTYRDRYIVQPGFAYLADFYHPDYHRNPPKEGQKDYRRTLYWNPDLQLDEEGRASVTFFNNSQTTRLCVEANGQAPDGTLLYNEK